MTPADAINLVGTTRLWTLNVGMRNELKIVPVKCVSAHGKGVVTANGLAVDIDMVWCEFKNSNGHTDQVWFTPEGFLKMQLQSTGDAR